MIAFFSKSVNPFRAQGDASVRRKEKEILDRNELEAVLREARVCRVGMSDGQLPYIVPLCFGYAENTFYFHCAAEGRKLEILEKNSEVCLELEAGVAPKPGAKACDWGMTYRSVIGFGRAERVEAAEAKRRALDLIMARYAPGTFEYPEAAIEKTVVLQVRVRCMTGKRSG
jgi:nitroimidazol reductase NimA-like FMN-containing flavoprotein (pyridoxamine 5'-phosphate oxidase superfamily)